MNEPHVEHPRASTTARFVENERTGERVEFVHESPELLRMEVTGPLRNISLRSGGSSTAFAQFNDCLTAFRAGRRALSMPHREARS